MMEFIHKAAVIVGYVVLISLALVICYMLISGLYTYLKESFGNYRDRMLLSNYNMTEYEFNKWIRHFNDSGKGNERIAWAKKNTKFYHTLISFKWTKLNPPKTIKDLK